VALPASSNTPTTSAASVNKSAPNSVRLSPSEIVQRRKDDKCSKCDELFMTGHHEHCKQLFIIEVVDEEEPAGLSPNADEPTISIHALTSIQPRTSHTMAILVTANGTHIIALLDSGSTHNFIDNMAASRVGIVLAGLSGLRVMVTNSDKLVSSGCCRNMAMTVHGEHFQINCYGLPLGSFDMVLGIQWLESGRSSGTFGRALWRLFATATVSCGQQRH
jgi:hypothetical protein